MEKKELLVAYKFLRKNNLVDAVSCLKEVVADARKVLPLDNSDTNIVLFNILLRTYDKAISILSYVGDDKERFNSFSSANIFLEEATCSLITEEIDFYVLQSLSVDGTNLRENFKDLERYGRRLSRVVGALMELSLEVYWKRVKH